MKQSKVADLLEINIPHLVEVWMTLVKEDEKILIADELSDQGLRDHIPQVLEEICGILRNGEILNVSNTQEGRVSVFTRLNQNYRGKDLIVETSLLRLTLMNYLHDQMHKPQKEIRLQEFTNSLKKIHLYLDEQIRYGFAVFTESLNYDLLKNNGQFIVPRTKSCR